MLLRDLGLYTGQVDGKQGPKTTEAVKKFQMMHGLIPDGIVGRNTAREFQTQLQVRDDRQSDTTKGIRTRKIYNAWPKESTASLMKFYGRPGTNQVLMDLPFQMFLAWDVKTTIDRISCNKKVADSMYRALDGVKKLYTEQEINDFGFNRFGGCLNVRKIRGGNRWSTHAWGIAIDIDPARNRLRWGRDKAFLARPECEGFHEAFKSEGGYNLGIHHNYDWMHTQFAYR